MKLHTVLVILALVGMVRATCFNRDRPCGLHSPHLLKFTVQFLSLPLAKSKKVKALTRSNKKLKSEAVPLI